MSVIYEEFDPIWGSQYMQPFFWLVLFSLTISAGVGFAMGANDVANSFGTSVGSKAVSIAQACVLAGVFNFIGAVVLGGSVTDTIRHKIVEIDLFAPEPHIYMASMSAAYVGAFVLVMCSTVLGMPVSTTHAVVGGVLGTSLAAFGNDGVNWFEMAMTATGWVVAPIFAGLVTAGFYLTQQRIVLREQDVSKALTKQSWFASIQVGLIGWMLSFFLITKIIDPIPEWLKINKLGKDKDPPTWPGSLAVPIVCFLVMAAVVLFSKFLLIPCLFKALENSSSVDKENENEKDEVTAEIEDLEGIDVAAPKHTEIAADDKKTSCCTYEDVFSLNHEDRPYALQKHVTKTAEELHQAADKYPPMVENRFKGIQIISASFFALSHGANDIANVIGPVSGILQAWKEGTVSSKAPTNFGIQAYGGVFIVLGLATFGRRVMATIGHNTTKITPSRGVNVELGAAFALTIASYLGIPTSSTQCAVGSVIAVGLCNREGSKTVNFKLFGQMFLTWTLTPFVAGLIGAAFFELFKVVAVHQVPGDFFPLSNASEVYGVHY